VGNLSLVFQTGAKTFHETCAMWGNPIPKKVACDTVKTFREVNHMFPKTWRAYESASVKAIQNPGQWFDASPFVAFACSTKAPFHRLVMRLPIGRQLCYPGPKVERTVKKHTDYETGETREWDSDDITYYGQRTGSVVWGRVNLYSGLLFQNCLAGDTLVVTSEGFVPLKNVTSDMRVWDGEEFVRSEGVVSSGVQMVISKGGITATPDHKFMLDNSWVSFYSLTDNEITSQSEEFIRDAVLKLDSSGSSVSGSPHKLVSALQMWARKSNGCKRDSEEERESEVVFSPVHPFRVESCKIPRAIASPYLRGSRLHDASVLQGKPCQLSQIWRAWYRGVQTVARPREILQRLVAIISGRFAHRPNRREQGLHPVECQMGQHQRKWSKQRTHPVHGDTLGQDDSQRCLREIGGGLHHTSLQDVQRFNPDGNVQETGHYEETFDIVNCGPRHRFAILTPSGLMIAHNCVQATARDIMQHGCVNAAKRGYEIFSVIHDEVLSYEHPDGWEGLSAALCEHPEWLPASFPLAATGSRHDYYTKD
jgi:hypothetical protein